MISSFPWFSFILKGFENQDPKCKVAPLFYAKNAENSFVSKCSEKQVSVFFFVLDKRNCKNTEYDVIEIKAYCAMVVIMETNWDNNLTWLLVLLTLFEAKTRQIDKLGW